MPLAALEPVLFVPDCHHPFIDKKAWGLFLKVGQALKPQHIIVIGDFADMFSVSAHSKDPVRATQLVAELAAVRKGLDELDALGAEEKHFLAGNHEDRLRRYLQDKAPELFGVVDIPTLLGLKERGWTYTPYKKHRKFGKLHTTHDLNGQSGRYSVFRTLDGYQHSVVSGHSHRFAYVVEGNAVGEQKISAQFGWLGDADQIDYMHAAKALKDWALGFGIGWLNPDTKIVYVTPVPIVRVSGSYTCCVGGRLYAN